MRPARHSTITEGGAVPFLLALIAALACRPNTTRPGLVPLPDAAGTEIRLTPREATRNLAEALRADSIPIRRVALRDAYLESGWFDTQTRRPAPAARALGPGVVQVRAWADPARPGSSQVVVETTYRAMLDPSLPQRELERQVARNHPVAEDVEGVLRRMVERYGGPPVAPAPASAPAARPEEKNAD
ncbi:MAG TPA: hypothetical protein VD930_11820 [Gemmatimonadales bacterium]|nr:hypothetical protein [Gemmatimonadales bacterium]